MPFAAVERSMSGRFLGRGEQGREGPRPVENYDAVVFHRLRQINRAGSAARADTPGYLFLVHPDNSQARDLGGLALLGVAGDEGNRQP